MEISNQVSWFGFCTAICAAFSISILSGQGLSPDEVRVTSRPYAPPSSNVFRVDTKLVEIGVVVRDSGGRAVPGLTKGNFQIHDNGKEREIANFALDSIASSAAPPTQAQSNLHAGTPAPDRTAEPVAVRLRFIALYIDDVNSKDQQHTNDLNQTQDAAEKFVKEALQPGVKVGVFTTSGAPKLDFTDDLGKLIETIASVRAHGRLSESGISVCPWLNPYLSYLIALRHDREATEEVAFRCGSAGAVQAEEIWRRAKELSTETLESIGLVADHLGRMPGSRVLLLASSGFLAATLEQQRDQIINRALQAGVVINALDSKGLYGYLPPGVRDVPLVGSGVAAGLKSIRYNIMQLGLRVDAMNEPLAVLAEGTGGIFFHNNNDLVTGFRELALPPEVTYRLSFRLPDGTVDGGYHRLKVTVVHAKHESVQARPGYFEPTKQAARETEPGLSKFDQEVLAADTIEDFKVDVSAQDAKFPGGEKAVSVIARVDISKLNFTRQADRLKQTIRFVSAFTDAQGAVVAAKEAAMELSLKDATYTRLLKSGINAKLTMPVPPGTYSLREVVEEISGQRFACSTHPIEIR